MDTIPGNDPMENQAPLSGLNPADLLRQGAAEDTFADGVFSAFHPPAMEEIGAAFPQLEILELIGQGGMGAVYKVRQKDLDRIVALKILPPAIGRSPESSSRFTREARALAKLNHPGIVTIHEFGQQEGLYYILMEFVDGVNLAQLMKSGRVSPREALAIVPQVCDALQYAHDQGIVHRDIKPENILMDRRGRVKVADFGIAKVMAAVNDPMAGGEASAAENQTLAGNIVGTPQYMAPEQISHPSDVDHRADIYALGVVFYQMLTGELPEKDLQAPSRKMQVDVRLDEIVLKALEKTPELRYQTAGIFKTQIENVASKMGGTSGNTAGNSSIPTSSPTQPPPRRFSAGWAIAIGCGVLALIPIVVLGVMALAFGYSKNRAMDEMTALTTEMSRTDDRSTQLRGNPEEQRLAEYDWKTLAAEGRLGAGVPVTRDGRSCLRIENPADKPMQARLLTIENPPIVAMRYRVRGEASHENVQGAAYLEMWSVFADGRYFSRTMGEPGSGPMGQLTGTSDWREFSLPFDRTGTDDAPDRIEVNLHLPGKGVVYLGPLELIAFMPDGEGGDHPGIASEVPKKDAEIEKATEAATAWLAGIDAGEYGRSWNEAGAFFRNSVTETAWGELMFALRQPLGAVKSRVLVKHENANSLPGAPDGKYVVMQFEASFARKDKAVETVTFSKEKDGSWRAAGYFIR